jgi:hypothetical protein
MKFSLKENQRASIGMIKRNIIYEDTMLDA